MNINDNVQWSVWINTVYLQARWPVPAERAPATLPLTLHNTGNYSRSISSSYLWGLDTDSTWYNKHTLIILEATPFVSDASIAFTGKAANNTHVCLTAWLGERPQVGDTGGCNADGWGVSGLDQRHTPPPRGVWGGAGCARQQSSTEEGPRSVRKRQKRQKGK